MDKAQTLSGGSSDPRLTSNIAEINNKYGKLQAQARVKISTIINANGFLLLDGMTIIIKMPGLYLPIFVTFWNKFNSGQTIKYL